MDWQEVSAISALIGVLIMVLGHAIAYGHFRAKADSATALAEKAMDKATKASDSLAAFREQAAKEFVTVEALGRIEGRIEEVGRDVRSGLDEIRNRMIDFFAGAARKGP